MATKWLFIHTHHVSKITKIKKRDSQKDVISKLHQLHKVGHIKSQSTNIHSPATLLGTPC